MLKGKLYIRSKDRNQLFSFVGSDIYCRNQFQNQLWLSEVNSVSDFKAKFTRVSNNLHSTSESGVNIPESASVPMESIEHCSEPVKVESVVCF